MLIDASKFPGPALWQAIMFLVLIVWALWLRCGAPRSAIAARRSLFAVIGIGIGLFIAIITLGPA